jgi:hypothetical protein
MVAVFTVYFEDPFWVGILESSEDSSTLTVARHVFGPEPSNAELLQFMLYGYVDMPRAGTVTGKLLKPCGRMNPKRAQRVAKREEARLPSTKSQAALASALEEKKIEHKALSREEKLASAERRFELRSEKRKRRRAGH